MFRLPFREFSRGYSDSARVNDHDTIDHFQPTPKAMPSIKRRDQSRIAATDLMQATPFA